MKLFIFSFIFLILETSYAEIRQTDFMKEVLREADGNTLVIFDIDNTLIEPFGQLGSDQWYYFLERKYREIDLLTEDQAYAKAMFVWNRTQEIIQVKAVEADTPDLIKDLQTRGIKTLGLTARTLDVADETLKQLKSVGIQLSNQPVYSSDLDIVSDDLARYTRGVLFVGDRNNKGKVLLEFLRRIGLTPARVIFVDDKMKHVKNVEVALQPLPVEYFGFRYGSTDKKVNSFNADAKELKLFFFGEL